MNKGSFSKILPHIIAAVTFLIVAALFCSPALSGKVIYQHDVVQWKGMANDVLQFKEQHGYMPLWTKSMFSGMPAFQIALESHNAISVGYFHYLFTLFLSKPIAVKDFDEMMASVIEKEFIQ